MEPEPDAAGAAGQPRQDPAAGCGRRPGSGHRGGVGRHPTALRPGPAALPGGRARRPPAGCPEDRPAAPARRAAHRGADDGRPARPGHGLEPDADGQGGRRESFDRGPHLERPRAQAPPGRRLQGQPGSAVRRETGGHRRPVSGPAGAGAGAVRGREEPDPGPGPHAAGAAPAAGPVSAR